MLSDCGVSVSSVRRACTQGALQAVSGPSGGGLCVGLELETPGENYFTYFYAYIIIYFLNWIGALW